MGAISDVVARMVTDVFNERDAERRAVALEAVFALDVVFSDTEGTVTGRDAVAEKVDAILAGAPGWVFRLVGSVQEVADVGLDRWQFGPPEGDPVVRGTDVAIIKEGRIVRLYTVVEPG